MLAYIPYMDPMGNATVVFSAGIPMNHDLPQKETPDLTGPDLKS